MADKKLIWERQTLIYLLVDFLNTTFCTDDGTFFEIIEISTHEIKVSRENGLVTHIIRCLINTGGEYYWATITLSSIDRITFDGSVHYG